MTKYCESIRTQIANDFDAVMDRFVSAQRRLWHRLRRHGWRVEKSDPSINWYRSDEFITVWIDWLNGEVEIEKGSWKNVHLDEGIALRRVISSRKRIDFNDFEKGNFSI